MRPGGGGRNWRDKAKGCWDSLVSCFCDIDDADEMVVSRSSQAQPAHGGAAQGAGAPGAGGAQAPVAPGPVVGAQQAQRGPVRIHVQPRADGGQAPQRAAPQGQAARGPGVSLHQAAQEGARHPHDARAAVRVRVGKKPQEEKLRPLSAPPKLKKSAAVAPAQHAEPKVTRNHSFNGKGFDLRQPDYKLDAAAAERNKKELRNRHHSVNSQSIVPEVPKLPSDDEQSPQTTPRMRVAVLPEENYNMVMNALAQIEAQKQAFLEAQKKSFRPPVDMGVLSRSAALPSGGSATVQTYGYTAATTATSAAAPAGPPFVQRDAGDDEAKAREADLAKAREIAERAKFRKEEAARLAARNTDGLDLTTDVSQPDHVPAPVTVRYER